MNRFFPVLFPISLKQPKSVQTTTFCHSKCLQLLCLDHYASCPSKCCSISLIVPNIHLPSVSGSINEGWCGCFLFQCFLLVGSFTVVIVSTSLCTLAFKKLFDFSIMCYIHLPISFWLNCWRVVWLLPLSMFACCCLFDCKRFTWLVFSLLK